MRRIVAVGLVCSASLSGCASTASHEHAAAEADTRLQELLLHYLISEAPPGDRTICVGFRVSGTDGRETRDPTPAQLERFGAAYQTVVPASECRLRDFAGPMIHHPTGDLAVKYETGVVEQGSTRARLMGSVYRGSLDAASCLYAARRASNADWTFAVEGPCVVS